ncbi:MAG: hypothetical protein KGH94_02260 [Candidatus Micrarchaeota archaeon]|nr:hypothetical protein [Candidatus Micrarchaeota archaeon]
MTTVNVATCSYSDVSAAVNGAAAGSIIQIPVGNCAWSSTLLINKSIVIKGAGPNSTVITNNVGGGTVFLIKPAGAEVRLSGLKIISSYQQSEIIDVIGPATVRIDNCIVINGFHDIVTDMNGQASGQVLGVVDHCTFINAQQAYFVTDVESPGDISNGCFGSSSCFGWTSWNRPIKPGQNDALVLENNRFVWNNSFAPVVSDWTAIYGQDGGRVVIRYNTFTASAAYAASGSGGFIDAHGDNPDYGIVLYEVYNNIFNSAGGDYANLRGGSALYYNNQFNGPGGYALELIKYWPTDIHTVHNTYFWNNTMNGNTNQASMVTKKDEPNTCSGCSATLVNGTATGSGDYFFRPPAAGDPLSRNGQSFYPYTPLAYPDPYITDCSMYPTLCNATSFGTTITSTSTTSTSTASTSATTTIFQVGSNYITVTVTNSNGAVSNFQEMVSFNPSGQNYKPYEAADLGNIRFAQGSTELYSWCESGCNSSSNNAIFWVKIPIVQNGNIKINMSFQSTSTEYDGVFAGEAPQLSQSYGQYDNGANVFDVYQDFKGVSVPPGWTESGSGITINNGVTTSPLNLGSASWITTSSTYGLSANQILELYGDYTGANGNDCSLNSGYVSHSSIQCNEGSTVGWNNACVSSSFTDFSYSGTYYCGSMGPPIGEYHLLYTYWPSSSMAFYSYDYSATQQITSRIPGSQAYIGVWMSGTGNPSLKLSYVRIRTYPPAGVMPTAVFGPSGSTTTTIVPITTTSAATTSTGISTTTIVSTTMQSTTTPATIEPGGNNGGVTGGNSGPGGIGGTVLPTVIYSNGCYTVSNYSQKNTETFTLNGVSISSVVNFIGPTDAGVTVNGRIYESVEPGQNYTILNTTSYIYTMRLLNLSYLPVERTIQLGFCSSPNMVLVGLLPNKTLVFDTNGNVLEVPVLSNPITTPGLGFWPGNLSIIANLSSTSPILVNVSKAVSHLPTPPENYTSAISINVSVSKKYLTNDSIYMTLGYDCNINSTRIVPFVLQNGAWEPITPFTTNRALCTVTFRILEDPIVALFIENQVSGSTITTIVQEQGSSRGASITAAELVAALVGVIIVAAIIAIYRWRTRSQKHTDDSSIKTQPPKEPPTQEPPISDQQ